MAVDVEAGPTSYRPLGLVAKPVATNPAPISRRPRPRGPVKAGGEASPCKFVPSLHDLGGPSHRSPTAAAA